MAYRVPALKPNEEAIGGIKAYFYYSFHILNTYTEKKRIENNKNYNGI